MVTKLTLALDESVVRKAKKYAIEQKISLSKLVEFYFSSLVSESHPEQHNLPPITAELAGMIKAKALKGDKELLTDTLIEKYT